MHNSAGDRTDFSAPSLIEGFAHVVALEGNLALLEPEQTGTCGGCASSSACGAKGIGTMASRLEFRRFKIENEESLVVGERVVIGVRENSLIKAAITAYVIPLFTLLLAGALAQWRFSSDVVTMAAMVFGLVLGLGFSRLGAGYLLSQGDLAPRFLRRARMGETCDTNS
jgi:sigma-E factor negative regulatory protein RseC